MRSRFAIFGHPIHPSLVPIPIGLALWSFVSIIVCVFRDRDEFWYDMSLWTGWATVVSGLVAALPGFGDYLAIGVDSDARVTGLAHMALNLLVVGLFVIACSIMLADGAREDGRLGLIVGLQAVAIAALGVSGWLGGELSFRHHLGVIPDDERMASDERTRHQAGKPSVGR
jgi:uncharacterized membrane protein